MRTICFPQDYLKDTKACLTNDFSRYKRALTSVRQDIPDADRLGQVFANIKAHIDERDEGPELSQP